MDRLTPEREAEIRESAHWCTQCHGLVDDSFCDGCPGLALRGRNHMLKYLLAELDRLRDRSLTFDPRFIEPILSGQKTQTTRLLKGKSWAVGEWYECRAEEGRAFARVRVYRVESIRLGLLMADDNVIREGFGVADREGFLTDPRGPRRELEECWLSLYGEMDPLQRVVSVRWDKVERTGVGE